VAIADDSDFIKDKHQVGTLTFGDINMVLWSNFVVSEEFKAPIIAQITNNWFIPTMNAIKDDDNYKIKNIRLQSYDMFGSKVGFTKVMSDFKYCGKPVPAILFLRGGAVAILPDICCQGKKYTILTVQRRVPISDMAYEEIPAGMLDGSSDFAGVAAKELHEETGIKLNMSDLIDLGVMIPSAGGCDERIRLYTTKPINLTIEQLNEFKGKLTGNLEEGESITLKIIEFDQIWNLTDAKALCALVRYQNLVKPQATTTTTTTTTNQ